MPGRLRPGMSRLPRGAAPTSGAVIAMESPGGLHPEWNAWSRVAAE